MSMFIVVYNNLDVNHVRLSKKLKDRLLISIFNLPTMLNIFKKASEKNDLMYKSFHSN